MEEERSSLRCGLLAVQVSFDEQSVEIITLFRHDVAIQMLRPFTGYEPKRKNGSYAYGTVMSTIRLNA